MSNHPGSKKPSESKVISIGGLADLTVEQIAALAKFVQQAGGIERAQQAIESLEKLKRAA
ncbi:MAG TPA: hypothetical protein VND64_35415 [Pirellulales bacterium]|nr:hypothetical protein [Pirellulales bacterium]